MNYHDMLVQQHKERRKRLWSAPQEKLPAVPEGKAPCEPTIKRVVDKNSFFEVIWNEIYQETGYRRKDVLNGRRSNDLASIRQFVMVQAHIKTSLSLPNIGRHMGGMDHTTVHHAIKKSKTDKGKHLHSLSALKQWLDSKGYLIDGWRKRGAFE